MVLTRGRHAIFAFDVRACFTQGHVYDKLRARLWVKSLTSITMHIFIRYYETHRHLGTSLQTVAPRRKVHTRAT